jgi:putative inorganic carbon (hco3(-)) transporter
MAARRCPGRRALTLILMTVDAANPAVAQPGLAPLPVTEPRGSSSYSLGFALLVLLTAVLFIRPAEIFPSLEGLPIYNAVIIACILASLPVLLRQLAWSNLRAQPGVFCVVALLPAIVLSQVVRGNFWAAREGAGEFWKVLVFFLLLTGLVNTPARLGRFVAATVIFIVVIAAIAELNYHGIINVQGISIEDRSVGVNEETGEAVTVEQLYGPGIFNDPNDFSLILSAGMLILLHLTMESRSWPVRLGLLAVCIVPGYAFAMTRSRGGFLALTSGLCILAVSRFGWKRSIPVMVIVLPLMLVLFGGRMTNINLDEQDTAQGRMMIWREGFAALKHSPIFGIGYGNYVEEIGHVAHNSFVHSFTELGLIGGILFTAILFVPISVLRRRTPAGDGDDPLARWRPGLLAVMTGYAVGLCTLTRVYTVSTYLIVGLGGVYCSLLAVRRPFDVPELTRRYFGKLACVGVACIVAFNIFVRIF